MLSDGVVRSRRSERKAARLTRGTRQPGSGCSYGRKGDVITKIFLVEDKTTQADSFRLTKATLDKARRDSIFHGKIPLVRITLSDVGDRETVWVLRENDALGLLTD